ncbi:type IV secretory pathway TraG/TraD family ATPase VirD4 [Microbacterium trichothecenolyticum]|uniref:type IV secretory system conjugative DNA transfer family protein n=1 Tax=Microbacterium trichothecenolyticum TaxID=69370 RepID=UPI00285D5098|nr:TraM recognition domain-containing protein [Microbacterium trichothecenolyticum]MDR7113729.1 type IV secretory pathway TraG/TraD family ATPase VirD4 [Microbacterium trichothecenolyticum]
MNQSVLGKTAAILVAAAMLLALAFGFIAEATTALTCGVRPDPANLFSGLVLAVTGSTTPYTAPAGCDIPVPLIRILDVVLVLLTAGLLGWVWVAVRRYRESDRAFITDLRTRPGFATASEIRDHLSARAVLRRAHQLRPDIPKPTATDVGWRVGRSRGQDVYVSIEDSVALEGPPRSGKGYRVLISAILDWSGPLITTSTTNDNLTATMRMRQTRGEVHVFDPQGLSGIRHPLRISPITGCEDPLVAMQRGAAIITGTALGSSRTNEEWAQASGVVLGRLLHAAAVGGKTVAELYDWGTSPAQTRAAVDILKTDGTPGWGDSLDATISADEKLVSSIWFGVQGAVAPLAVPQIRDALLPRPGDPVFDPREFLDEANTLYLIGSSSGASAMGAWLGAVLDDIVEVARTTALASPGSRLPHPLGLILDEIANMFRWGNLPRIMADGGGRGICTFIVLQALSQAETSWSRAEADTIWAAATAKVLLGGASHVGHLRDIESLLGTRDTRREQRSWSTRETGHATSEHHERRPLMSVDEIRRLPPSVGLLAYRNRRSVLLDLAGWDERSDAHTIQISKRETEQEQRAVFDTANRTPTSRTTGVPESASAEAVEGDEG